MEFLVVIAVIAAAAALLLPVWTARRQQARIGVAREDLRTLVAALGLYRDRFGGYPPSSAPGENAGAEALAESLLAGPGGALLRDEPRLGDTDGDGRRELLDPWGNPWVYLHASAYRKEGVFYRLDGDRQPVEPARKGDAFIHAASYQLWACGPNGTSEAGWGDDVANVNP